MLSATLPFEGMIRLRYRAAECQQFLKDLFAVIRSRLV